MSDGPRRYGPLRREFRRFLRDLPALMAIGAVVAALFIGWRIVVDGEPVGEMALLGVAIFCGTIVLAPLGWLRWRGLPRRRGEVGPWLPLFGAAIGWWAFWVGLLIVALALMDALGPR